jgi:hypothetical protein
LIRYEARPPARGASPEIIDGYEGLIGAPSRSPWRQYWQTLLTMRRPSRTANRFLTSVGLYSPSGRTNSTNRTRSKNARKSLFPISWCDHFPKASTALVYLKGQQRCISQSSVMTSPYALDLPSGAVSSGAPLRPAGTFRSANPLGQNPTEDQLTLGRNGSSLICWPTFPTNF